MKPLSLESIVSSVAVRAATPADAPALCRLMAQLGYPAPETYLARRLARVLDSLDHVVILATRDEAPVGLAHVALLPLLEDEGSAHLLALVVDEVCRGQGVGTHLVAAAETWAAASGCVRIVVRSNIVRTRTHGFYERLGYTCAKTQLQFRKPLASLVESPFARELAAPGRRSVSRKA